MDPCICDCTTSFQNGLLTGVGISILVITWVFFKNYFETMIREGKD